MSKTPEEMAEEYCNTKQLSYVERLVITKGFLDGYEAAKQWISVKDRLPEDGQTCLYAIYIPKKNEWKLDYGEWQAKEEVFYGEYLDYRDLNWTVTHWMPLPSVEGLKHED